MEGPVRHLRYQWGDRDHRHSRSSRRVRRVFPDCAEGSGHRKVGRRVSARLQWRGRGQQRTFVVAVRRISENATSRTLVMIWVAKALKSCRRWQEIALMA